MSQNEPDEVRAQYFVLEKDGTISCSFGTSGKLFPNTGSVEELKPGDKTYEQVKLEHNLNTPGDSHEIIRKRFGENWLTEEVRKQG